MAVATRSSVLSVEDVNKTLEDSLESVFQSDRFNDLLEVMSKMKNYSLNNTLLIVAQRPQATMVMGFKEWQKLGRFVDRGEKSIKILAPMIGKKEKEKLDPLTNKPQLDQKGNVITEKQNVIRGFRPVSVFDVSQTSGKEIPSVRDFIAREMEEDSYMSKLYNDYKTFLVDTKGVDVQEAETETGVGGYFNRATDEIVISTNNNDNNTAKFRVLVHEYAHALLHHKESDMKDLPRGHKEAQAESVAFVVSNYYGLDSTAVSAGYIATWSKDMELARKALNEIQTVANEIIDDVDRLQKEKINSFYKDQSKDYEEAKEFLVNKIGVSEKAFDPNEKEETQLQLFNKDNGYVLSGRLEYSEKNEMFYLRTNRNLIEPLSELSQEGKLKVLNVEKELGKLKDFTEYSRIPDHYEVKKVRNGPYLIQSANGQDIISKGFEKREDAKDFHLRSSISQALHQSTFLKKELSTKGLHADLQQVSQEIETQINECVGAYLTHHGKKQLNLTGDSGITVGWTLLKNPNIKTLNDLENFSSDHKHVPSYTKLPEALKEIKEVTNEKPKEMLVKKTVDTVELEQSIER